MKSIMHLNWMIYPGRVWQLSPPKESLSPNLYHLLKSYRFHMITTNGTQATLLRYHQLTRKLNPQVLKKNKFSEPPSQWVHFHTRFFLITQQRPPTSPHLTGSIGLTSVGRCPLLINHLVPQYLLQHEHYCFHKIIHWNNSISKNINTWVEHTHSQSRK